MKNKGVHLLDCMQKLVALYPQPLVVRLVKENASPFLVLLATILSSRSRDIVIEKVVVQLRQYVATPEDIIQMQMDTLESIIRPVGLYRTKARAVRSLSKEIGERFGGVVPSVEKDLLSLPGVGLKTAHLVQAEVFGIPAVCVDTHVSRIARHLGLTKGTDPIAVERDLRCFFPEDLWIMVNRIFVPWGQFICPPRSRKCCCRDALARQCGTYPV
ncbi:MAG: endonuclease III [Candidatus Babeliaceae bacterium]|nr:endonuclease III [Candidatus Babeliaceae bacterium]